jgi:8-oxo-dGTP pyrophosphatase MutT (NUDIX family)
VRRQNASRTLSESVGYAWIARYPTMRVGRRAGGVAGPAVYDSRMPATLDVADLRSRLDADPRPTPPPDTRLAAVLVPMVGGGPPSIVFTRRTEHLSRHAGEISFPGGLRHDDDVDLRATALRETYEELGLDPAAVDVLGGLPSVHTFVSAILIVPFVGSIDGRPSFRPNEAEIAEVLEFPLADLDATESLVEFPRSGSVYRGYAYEMPGATIWGATAHILHDLLETLRADQGTTSTRGGRT